MQEDSGGKVARGGQGRGRAGERSAGGRLASEEPVAREARPDARAARAAARAASAAPAREQQAQNRHGRSEAAAVSHEEAGALARAASAAPAREQQAQDRHGRSEDAAVSHEEAGAFRQRFQTWATGIQARLSAGVGEAAAAATAGGAATVSVEDTQAGGSHAGGSGTTLVDDAQARGSGGVGGQRQVPLLDLMQLVRIAEPTATAGHTTESMLMNLSRGVGEGGALGIEEAQAFIQVHALAQQLEADVPEGQQEATHTAEEMLAVLTASGLPPEQAQELLALSRVEEADVPEGQQEDTHMPGSESAAQEAVAARTVSAAGSTELGMPSSIANSPSVGSSGAGDGTLSDRHLAASPASGSARSAGSGRSQRSEEQARRLHAVEQAATARLHALEQAAAERERAAAAAEQAAAARMAVLEQAAAERAQAANERMTMLAQSQAMLAQLSRHHGAIAQLQQQNTGLTRQWAEAQDRMQAFEEHTQQQHAGFGLQWEEAQARLHAFEEVAAGQAGLQLQVDGIAAEVQTVRDSQTDAARVVQRLGDTVAAQARQVEEWEAQQHTVEVILQQHDAERLRVAKQLEKLQSRLSTDAQGRVVMPSAKGKGKGGKKGFVEAPPGFAEGADQGQEGKAEWHGHEIQDLQERMNVVQAELESLREFTNEHWEGQTALAAESRLAQLQSQMTALVGRLDALPPVKSSDPGDTAWQSDHIEQLRQGYEAHERQLARMELNMRLKEEGRRREAEAALSALRGRERLKEELSETCVPQEKRAAEEKRAALPTLEVFNERSEAELRIHSEETAQALQTLRDAQAESEVMAQELTERVTALSTSQSEVIGALAIRFHAVEAGQPALAEQQLVLEAAFESFKQELVSVEAMVQAARATTEQSQLESEAAQGQQAEQADSLARESAALRDELLKVQTDVAGVAPMLTGLDTQMNEMRQAHEDARAFQELQIKELRQAQEDARASQELALRRALEEQAAEFRRELEQEFQESQSRPGARAADDVRRSAADADGGSGAGNGSLDSRQRAWGSTPSIRNGVLSRNGFGRGRADHEWGTGVGANVHTFGQPRRESAGRSGHVVAFEDGGGREERGRDRRWSEGSGGGGDEPYRGTGGSPPEDEEPVDGVSGVGNDVPSARGAAVVRGDTLWSPGAVLSVYFHDIRPSFWEGTAESEFSTDQKAFPNPRQDEVPKEIAYHVITPTMKPQSAENYKKQVMFQLLERLESHFELYRVTLARQRQALLLLAMKETAQRAQLDAALSSGRVRCDREGRPFGWAEMRRIVLDEFSPLDWLHQTLTLWRDAHVQGTQRAREWVTRLTNWNRIINRLLPQEGAISRSFSAVLMRGGASTKMEQLLKAEQFDPYDPEATATTILRIGDRFTDGCAEKTSKLATVEVRRLEFEEDVAQSLGFENLGELRRLTGEYSATQVVQQLRSLQESEAVAKRMQYTGALAEYLSNRGVDQELFEQRFAQWACVCCGEKGHRLFQCKDYNVEALETIKSKYKKARDEVVVERDKYKGKFQALKEASAMRPEVRQRTAAQRNRTWAEQQRKPSQDPAALARLCVERAEDELARAKRAASAWSEPGSGGRAAARVAQAARSAPSEVDKEERFGVSSEFDSDEEEAADLREAVLTLGELGNDGQGLRRH